MRIKIIAAVAAAIIIASGATWYFYSPRYTINQMRAAAEANDPEKLAEYIDFPALRASMKEQLKAQMAAEMVKQDNGFAALGAAIGMNMVDGLIDGMITPSGMRAIFMKNKDQAGQPGIRKVDGASDKLELKRTSFNRFELSNPENPGATLVFKRDGFGWQLFEMRVPMDSPASTN